MVFGSNPTKYVLGIVGAGVVGAVVVGAGVGGAAVVVK